MIARLKRWKTRAAQLKRLAQWCFDALGSLETEQAKLHEADRVLLNLDRDAENGVTMTADEYKTVQSAVRDSRGILLIFIEKVKRIKQRLEAL